MSIQLINLRGVPDDEANEIRALLTEHEIEFYETKEGGWGVSLPAIWLKDESQLPETQKMLADYQAERLARAKQAQEEERQAGLQPTFLGGLSENPLQVIVYIALAFAVLYFSIMPFIDLGSD